MFFVVSKIFWILASPITLLLIVAIVGVCPFMRDGTRRPGERSRSRRLRCLAAAATTPLGVLLVAPLEDRFPEPPADLAPPDGIIMLGSAVNGESERGARPGRASTRATAPRRRRSWRSAIRTRG